MIPICILYKNDFYIFTNPTSGQLLVKSKHRNAGSFNVSETAVLFLFLFYVFVNFIFFVFNLIK